jgi:integrase
MGVRIKEWKGSWWVFVNHKGRRKAKKCASKKAAELARDQIDARLKLGQLDVLEADQKPSPPTVPTFAEYAERWLESVGAVRLRLSSLEQYRVRLKLRLLPTLGPLPLIGITRETVRNLIGEMVRLGNFRSQGQSPSRSTLRETLGTLSAILTTAEEDGLIPTNPARRMGRNIAATGTVEARDIEVFDREELMKLLEVTERDSPEFYPLVLCLARTGMRTGEAFALAWQDIDWKNRAIFVRRSRRRNRISEPKNGKVRRADMSAQLAAVLRGLKSIQEAEAVVRGVEPPERVFNAPDGGPVREDVFRRFWVALLRRTEVRYRKPHTLRHTFASLLLEAGEPILYVQQQLGHHSPAFTLRVYGHLLPRGERRAVDLLDDATSRNPRATFAPMAGPSA